ncbi:MAG: ubiquinone biosynthesis protein [Alphaproteobacteria bacterium]|nr:MAG: ubiquinone biosynthesis protein [Alphaproteobacteria bacterium]
MKENTMYDIAIIGGGLAGLSLAILLGKQGWRVACIDRDDIQKQTGASYDIRTTAISYGSRNVLRHAGIWQDMEERAQPIKDILILDEDSPIDLEFKTTDIEAEAFGWIVDNRDLRETLIRHVQGHENITHLTGESATAFDHSDANTVTVTLANKETLSAKLIVGADGRNSFTREFMQIGTWEHDYNQNAIVCLINHEKPHHGVALEHFRSQGPFAVLPFTDDADGNHQSAVVWSVERADSEKWLNCSDDVFNAALQTRCGTRFGNITSIGSRAAWPLTLKKAYSYIGNRMCLVAEAAHGIHPIAGQGLNMSLRDIAALTENLKDTKDPGDASILKAYQANRRGDNFGMAIATDGLNGLFGSDISPIRAMRRFGLHAVSKLPFAKKFFMKQAMGAGGHLPDLVREFG